LAHRPELSPAAPDISLFYAATPVAKGSGQTIFASGHLAYEALPADLKAQVETLQGLHAQPGSGRGRGDAEAGKTPPAVLPHQRSQKQPVVRTHPVTGAKALYLCEAGQMDWFDGPFVGLEPGPHGAGAKLLDRLMNHYTRPEFIYVMNGLRATCWCGTIDAWFTPRPGTTPPRSSA
jgi:taurine dioxygenase